MACCSLRIPCASQKKKLFCARTQPFGKSKLGSRAAKCFLFFFRNTLLPKKMSVKKKMTRNSNSVTMLPRLRNQNKQNNKMFINFFYLQIFQILVRSYFLFMYSLDFSMSQIPVDRKRYVHAHKFKA